MQLQERIDASRMSPYQWLIVGLCIVLNALDRFDVLAMAFTANSVAREELGLQRRGARCISPAWSVWPSDRWAWRPSPT